MTEDFRSVFIPLMEKKICLKVIIVMWKEITIERRCYPSDSHNGVLMSDLILYNVQPLVVKG